MLKHSDLLLSLDYNQETGLFKHKTKIGGVTIGAIAGYLTPYGYLQIRVNNKLYMAHRLAWFYIHKTWPLADLDHINRDRTDNRINNLRECSRSYNNCNSKIPKSNTTGIKGISFDPVRQRYRAYLNLHGQRTEKRFSLAYYKTKEKALEAATLWINELRSNVHGEFANHGI